MRKKKDQEVIDVLDATNDALTHLHENYQGKLFVKYTNMIEHPLYVNLQKKLNGKSETDKAEAVPLVADEIFAEYLEDSSKKTNKSYFDFLVKFVSLFRECINQIRKTEGTTKEYTQVTNAETVPDLCNDFITDFMETHDYFALDPNELIEIIQHFSNWLYESKHTMSRLTLLS